MKRSKTVSRGPRDSADDSESPFFTPKPAEPAWSFDEHVSPKPDDIFVPYSLKTRFERGTLLVHPKFGRGLVTTVEGARIEVLFQDGSRKLGHAAS